MNKWIYAPGQRFFQRVHEEEIQGNAAQYFRRQFKVEGNVQSAHIEITARGLYVCYINGENICDSYLNPGWCDYRKTIRYQRYDVTELVSEGENAIGCVLGDGWFGGVVGLLNERNYEGPNMLLVRLTITTNEGKFTLYSDNTWHYATGAIKTNSLLNGEYVDARDDLTNFSKVGYKENDWKTCLVFEDDFLLTLQDYELIKCVDCITPRLITISEKQFFDFEQNFAGIIRARIFAEQGTVLRFRYAEEIKSNGELYLENLRRAKATDYYVAKGNGEEFFEPMFTYHGFRYVTVEVLSGRLDKIELCGKVLTSDLPQAGTFITSSPLLNKIYEITEWSRKANFMSIPTDCPQRDERLGWTGDIQVFAKSSMYMSNGHKFLKKYLEDVRYSALENGSIYDLAPYVKEIANNGNNVWGDVAITLPYELYYFYGDKTVLSDNYEMMKNWMTFLLEKTKDDIRIDTSTTPGDWLGTEKTDLAYVSTVYTAQCAKIMAEISEILGEDGSFYDNVFRKMKKAILKKYTDGNDRLLHETQAGYAVAIYYDILPLSAGRHLVRLLEANGNRVTTGFIGTKMLLPVLSTMGRADMAYAIAQSVEYPSWGYMITHGATSMWENWNAITMFYGAKVFNDASMNSFNHFALGSVVEWFYEYVLGIHNKESGFKKIRIEPTISNNAPQWASGSLVTVSGDIQVKWKRHGNSVNYTVTKPETLPAEFGFENVLQIRCDGVVVKEFNEQAKVTEIVYEIKGDGRI